MNTQVQIRKRRIPAGIAALIAAAMLCMPLSPLLAFNPNFLLSDFELTDGNALSRKGIQDFLQSKGSALARLQFDTPSGRKSSADIIFDAGRYYRISQKYLLVLLQKEQSLVAATNPSQERLDWAMGYGVCDSCSKDDPALRKYKGFFNQVNWAAKRIRESYLADIMSRGYTVSGWGPGITKVVDGVEVTPENMATAALYTYTPHIHGNQNFVRLWNQWFQRKFPNGVILREGGTNTYYLISQGQKRQFVSETVLRSSYDPSKAIQASASELAAYETGAPISFANYSLLQSPGGTIYLLVNGVKRGIASREAFRTIGFNPEEVQQASWNDLNAIPEGAPIDLGSAYPAGALLQSATSGGIGYVENGVMHPIYSKEVFLSRFKNRPVIRVAHSELSQYPVGSPVLFQDGELVTSPGSRSVYFIIGGQKRPVASAQDFEKLGFRWNNIVWTNDTALSVHPLGEPLAFETPGE